MNYNRKILILASSLMIATLVGCGETNQSVAPSNDSAPVESTPTESTPAESTPATVDVSKRIFHVPSSGFDTSKEVNIVFYHTMNKNLQQVLEAYIDDFNKLYPNIVVEHHAIGGYDDVKDQNTQAISSGKNDCDLAYCYPDHIASYNKANSVYALNELIDSNVEIQVPKFDPDTEEVERDGSGNVVYQTETIGFTQAQKDDFIEAYWEEGYSIGDGNMYALPLTKSSEVMYYNKTFFETNNLQVPSTWNEMFKVCEDIKKIDPASIPLGYDSSSNMFITLCEQYKTGYTSADANNHFIFDNATNKEIVEGFKSMYSLGYLTTKGLYGTYTSGLFTETGATAQKSYMSIGSSAGATNQMPPKDTITGSAPFEVGIYDDGLLSAVSLERKIVCLDRELFLAIALQNIEFLCVTIVRRE